MVIERNVRRQWSERVIPLGPDKCQSGELLFDWVIFQEIPVTKIDFRCVRKG